jgi:hypothetical protein
MKTILIAHHDIGFAEHLASGLRAAGYYTVLICPGPWPPMRCIRCDKGYCPLTEGADLMIYDPQLSTLDDDGHSHNLASHSALAQPEVPMLLAWSPDALPDAGTLRSIRAVAPWVHVAAHDPAALLRQVNGLLAVAATATVSAMPQR